MSLLLGYAARVRRSIAVDELSVGIVRAQGHPFLAAS